MNIQNRSLKLASLALLVAALPASASLLVYESFDYADTGPSDGVDFLGDGGQAGGLGLTAWRQANSRSAGDNEVEVSVPGLDYSDGSLDLVTAGGHAVRTVRQGQNSISSTLTPTAASGLTADNTTLWMSFLYVDNGFSGPDSAIALTSEDMVAADSANLTSAGYGVGVDIVFNAGIGTAVYNGGVSSTSVRESAPSFNAGGTNAGLSSDVFLLAAKINWNPDGTDDEIFVFNITDLSSEPDESAALASDTFNMLAVNQALLDTLTISETQVDGFDEIRLGTTFESVVPAIPEPSSLALIGLGGLLLIRRRQN